jgi:hypothetical protein
MTKKQWSHFFFKIWIGCLVVVVVVLTAREVINDKKTEVTLFSRIGLVVLL